MIIATKENVALGLNIETIEHCALESINNVVGNPWEYCDKDDGADGMRLVALGAVAGILDFVDEIKRELEKRPRAPMPEEDY